ncbi:MAG: helix-turn-helix domain-containing protein [Ignavibacteriales bacterium]|nr:helix-turn-helix domain-containing protein [Ignavibacteriales bacterium]
MKNKINNFNGIYGEFNSDTLSEYFYSEMLETRSRTFTWSIKCHIHSRLYQLFIINKSGGILTSSIGKFDLFAPSILWIPPSHVHGFEWNPDVSGRIITISETTINTIIGTTTGLSLQLSELFVISRFRNREDVSSLNRIIEKMDDELFSNLLGREEMVNFLKGQLIIQLSRIINDENNIKIEESNPGLKHFAAFNSTIGKLQFGEKSVEEVASELQISPGHLNRICHEFAAKSASELIRDSIIEKAKRLLRHTSYSISEIAFSLNLDDPAYFSRLFKKSTGSSPREFRNNIG